jgi:transcriptional regulator with XRE-family HTH domain
MDGRKLVAWNLRRLRVLRDLSQEKLAVDAGIDRTYVGRLERGLENPTVGVLDRLADALAIRISDFFVVPAPGETRPKPLRGGRRKLEKAQSKSSRIRRRRT